MKKNEHFLKKVSMGPMCVTKISTFSSYVCFFLCHVLSSLSLCRLGSGHHDFLSGREIDCHLTFAQGFIFSTGIFLLHIKGNLFLIFICSLSSAICQRSSCYHHHDQRAWARRACQEMQILFFDPATDFFCLARQAEWLPSTLRNNCHNCHLVKMEWQLYDTGRLSPF